MSEVCIFSHDQVTWHNCHTWQLKLQQYTNVVEVVVVLIGFLGNMTDSLYKLYEDAIGKSENEGEIPVIE